MTALCLSAPSAPLARWLAWAWPEAWATQALDWPSAAAQVQSQGGLWMLQPDTLAGPRPEELARFWRATAAADPAPAPGPLLLVLVPSHLGHGLASWLDAGADRCLPSDSPPALVMAMLQAMARRLQPPAPTAFGPLRYDHASRTLWVQQQRVALTRRETQLLHLLMQAGMRLVRSADIVRALGEPAGAVPRRPGNWASLHVHRLNRKLQPHGVKVEWVQRYGYGLRLLAPQVPAHSAEPPALWSAGAQWPPRAT